MSDDRGQAFTLEGLTAAVLLLTILFLSMQAIVLTPTMEGGVDRDMSSQLATEANDVLAASHEQGELLEVALAWDFTDGDQWAWEDGDVWMPGHCPEIEPGDELGLCSNLNETFTERGYRYNVYADYRNATAPAQTETRPIFEQGTPDDSSVTATRSVALYDGIMINSQQSMSDVEASYFAKNVDEADPLYNIVEFRVVVW